MDTFNEDPKPGRLVLPLVLIGMIATTWVQIIKAFLLIFGASILAYLVFKEFSFFRL